MRSGIAIFVGIVGLLAFGAYRLNRPLPAPHAATQKRSPPESQASTALDAHLASAPPAPAPRQPDRTSASVKPAKPVLASAASTVALPAVSREAFATFWADPKNARQADERLLHDRLLAEPIDPNWSPNVEANLRAYLQQMPSGPSTDVMGVECRATTCEVLTASKLPDDAGIMQFQQDIFMAPRQSWWSGYGLKDTSFTVTTIEDGRWISVVYFTTSRITFPTR